MLLTATVTKKMTHHLESNAVHVAKYALPRQIKAAVDGTSDGTWWYEWIQFKQRLTNGLIQMTGHTERI